MNDTLGIVHSIQVGKVTNFTRPNTSSAINKKPIKGSIYVNENGICGDEQGDLKHHGGRDKAVHFYPFEHYEKWQQEIGDIALLKCSGAFGENISTIGITEQDLYLGDRLRVGEVLFEISQGRRPCWKLSDRFQLPDMAERVQKTLQTGYYCRVIEAGFINSGDDIILAGRSNTAYSIKQIMEIIFEKQLDRVVLNKLLELPLVESWRNLVEKRLALAQAEDGTSQIIGPKKTWLNSTEL
ncbi:MAG: MOSC domain-containing protein [Methylotenera sp.]